MDITCHWVEICRWNFKGLLLKIEFLDLMSTERCPLDADVVFVVFWPVYWWWRWCWRSVLLPPNKLDPSGVGEMRCGPFTDANTPLQIIYHGSYIEFAMNYDRNMPNTADFTFDTFRDVRWGNTSDLTAGFRMSFEPRWELADGFVGRLY